MASIIFISFFGKQFMASIIFISTDFLLLSSVFTIFYANIISGRTRGFDNVLVVGVVG